MFPGINFANYNEPEKQFQISLNEDGMSELPAKSNSILKWNMVGCYGDHPNKVYTTYGK